MMSGEDSARQVAQGSYIAQAHGEGAQAKVEITQQAPLSPTVAIAPAPPSYFIGRRRILDALKEALADGHAMALQGMGGIGKTATAQKLAAEISPEFLGGVFWGALSDHAGNPHAILRTWGRACGQDVADEADLKVLANLVRGLLAARRADRGPLMAIVDDVRGEWLDASKLLQQALPADTPLLLTTRDETNAAVLGASVVCLDELPPDEALTLLKVHAGTAVVAAELEAARALLETGGYLPLAIEIAGKRLGLLGRKPGSRLENLCQAIQKRAVETLRLPGYPGLAVTFAITYEVQLTEVQRLFRWLGVFAVGPLYLTSVAGVLDWEEAATEQALDALVLTALLAWGEEEGKYTLHPLLRQYAEVLLAEAGEVDEARRQHMVYYRDLVLDRFPEDKAAHESMSFLDAVSSNVTVAFAFAGQTGDSQSGLALLNVTRRIIDLYSLRANSIIDSIGR